VDHLLATLAAAVGVFAGTNVDDLVVLTVWFLSSVANGRPRRWQIWAGQYAGIAVLVAVSALAALGLQLVPDRWVGLLGLVPFGLGVRGLVTAMRSTGSGDAPSVPPTAGLMAVFGVTIANGADNVSVYTPTLRTLSVTDGLITLAVFAAGVAVWCLTGAWLGSHKKVIAVIERYGQWLVPAVFMLIGTMIVLRSAVIGRALDLL
jgi:cadmium resistance protein CadD (predicted permease)